MLHLSENMQVDPHDPQSVQCAQWLSVIGQVKDLPLDHSITLPQHMICGPHLTALISAIYANLHAGQALEDRYFLEGALLCLHNNEVDEINDEVFKQFPGEERLYSSADFVKGAEEGDHYPLEYLNFIAMGGLPTSQLKLKLEVPLILP